ncbi:hypothetical protein MRB53_003630 [Persea americana]|uniref:Uncharacterized protein n=1 Tax=Persea americana TaxID=3435 RepID=A0ACC2MXS2_PERAE|nr:hypothetical protein MRB53_003630 [Persea americana]
MLKSVSVSSKSNPNPPEDRILYTYKNIFHGFASKLTAQESQRITKIPGVIGLHKDSIAQLHVTRSPGFLGLNTESGLWPDTNMGDGIIIGLVDTGIWPESQCFSDEGLEPVRKEWKGECENGTGFNSSMCNNKLVGARYFLRGIEAAGLVPPNEELSPRDLDGHGTHTASTAAGSQVLDASMLGFAKGTVRGMVSKAKIAMYKACWVSGCAKSDIAAAMDRAIEDGVDVLSVSIGSPDFHTPYYSEPIAIAAFAAADRGIFVACSAGNDGPSPSLIINTAPWITTVGAGSLDRTFPVQLRLGNGKVYSGDSLYNEEVNVTQMFPIFHLEYCNKSLFTPSNVMGKIVVCKGAGVDDGFLVQEAGGMGLVGLNWKEIGEGTTARAFPLPSLSVGYREGLEISSYINTTNNSTANIMSQAQTVLGKLRAPMVAAFSSRGPNPIVPEILKPDIVAPGLNILAAWPSDKAPTFVNRDRRRVRFNILSGTSMSCPHIAGIAALLRKAHPSWSPAAIRSALMTTASQVDSDHLPIVDNFDMERPATPLDFGAGHVHPQMAEDPGLVYDVRTQDYINFLCTLNYTEIQLRSIIKDPFSCSKLQGGPGALNYPSFSVVFHCNNGCGGVQVLNRTLMSVSELPENYSVRVVNSRPDKSVITVKPERLIFSKMYDEQSFSVEFLSFNTTSTGNSTSSNDTAFGYVIWESDSHMVRSPVVLAWT